MNGYDFLPAAANRNIGRAMHDWSMLAHGDRVLVGVSGGVDSLVLSTVLLSWQKKAPIRFDLLAVHLDMGFEPEGAAQRLVTAELKKINIPYLVETTDFGPRAEKAEDGKSVCFHCARRRRSRIFDLAHEHGCTKIALGHHKDDILETFLLNLLYSGNLSTMVPCQKLFHNTMAIIRPLAYLQKTEIREIAERAGLIPVKNPCPHDSGSHRQKTRALLAHIHDTIPNAGASMFNALGNVREEYLLTGRRKNHSTP